MRLRADQLSHTLGPFADSGGLDVGEVGTPFDPRVARIGAAVRAVARWLPFRAKCLEQAIAARAMLRRRGIVSVLRLGVVGGDVRLLHAWLDTCSGGVTGYPLPPSTVEIACCTAG